jgi:hypothetical protein
MLLPFLALLVACIFFTAWAVGKRTAVTEEVRLRAFVQRREASPGVPLDLTGDPMVSLVSARARRPVAGGPAFPGTTFEATSFNGVTAKTWDHEDVRFVPRPPFTPDFEVLDLIARNCPTLPPASGPALGGFRALDFRFNPVALGSLAGGE